MKKRRVAVLMHEDLIPPEDDSELTEAQKIPFKCEKNVIDALTGAGHEVIALGARDELKPIRVRINETKPHVVFNLLEEFNDIAHYDHAMVSYFDLMGVAYTGCGPRGMILARDKALSKQILVHHRVRVPRFAVCQRGRKVRRPKRLRFPLIVKALDEEGSVGIAQASLVRSDDKLAERVEFIHASIGCDAIVEEFVEGREIYASVLGNKVLQVFPTWELIMENLPKEAPLINTQKSKWDLAYQKRWGIDHGPAKLASELEDEVHRVAKRIYRTLRMVGYARIDFRLSDSGRLYFLEANPNPDISREEEFSWSAKAAGYSYEALLEKIMRLGIRRRRQLKAQ